jgi:hypothetical protein
MIKLIESKTTELILWFISIVAIGLTFAGLEKYRIIVQIAIGLSVLLLALSSTGKPAPEFP